MFSSRLITGLPQLPEGAPQEIYSQLVTIYNAINNLTRYLSQFAGIDEQDSSVWSQLSIDDTVFPGTLGRWYVKQNEAINFGQVVSPIVVGSELRVQLANSTNNTKFAVGICTSQDHTPGVDNFCEVAVGIALITGIAGMTPGQRYWLSKAVSGAIINTPSVAAGNIEQYVGWALASNRLLMTIDGSFVQH